MSEVLDVSGRGMGVGKVCRDWETEHRLRNMLIVRICKSQRKDAAMMECINLRKFSWGEKPYELVRPEVPKAKIRSPVVKVNRDVDMKRFRDWGSC